MHDLITDLYRQNEWANLTLLDACRELSDAQLDASAPGTYGSIRATLSHLVGSETGYAFRPGDADIVRIRSDDPWPGFDRLAGVVRATATAAIRNARAMTSDPLTIDAPDRPSLVAPTVVLVQMVNHSTEHRSQVSTILTTLGSSRRTSAAGPGASRAAG